VLTSWGIEKLVAWSEFLDWYKSTLFLVAAVSAQFGKTYGDIADLDAVKCCILGDKLERVVDLIGELASPGFALPLLIILREMTPDVTQYVPVHGRIERDI
jgi:hypothetical protein